MYAATRHDPKGIDGMRCDVIVVGAGPAGSTVARELAKRGISVAMLDRAAFPRDKPCGGAVSTKCEKQIGLNLSSVIERTVSDVSITMNQHPPSELFRSSAQPFGHLTQRRSLDALMAEKALEAGAVFRQRTHIRSIEPMDTGVTVRTSDDVFCGRILVAADGANGVTARLCGIKLPNHNRSIALEGNISPKDGVSDKWSNAIGIDFGSMDGGYGWILPKGDHLNIGVGGYTHVGPKLRTELKKLVKFYGHAPESLWGLRGHHLPQRHETSAVVSGNVVLIGDAAGLVDPLTGEGIFAAVYSAQIAAVSIASHLNNNTSLEAYQQNLERDILSDITAAKTLHDLFYRWPGIFYRIERSKPLLWRAMLTYFCGDATYVDLSQKLGHLWPVMRTTSRLMRTVSEFKNGAK